MSTSELYWILTLDGILVGMGFLAVFAIVSGVMFVGIATSNIDHGRKPPTSSIVGVVVSSFVFFLCIASFIFIPSTKQMMMLKTVPAITQNKKVQEMPEKLIEAVDKKLDEYLKEK